MNRKYSKFLTVILIIIIIAIIGLLAFLGFDYYSSSKKSNEAETAAKNFEEGISTEVPNSAVEIPNNVGSTPTPNAENNNVDNGNVVTPSLNTEVNNNTSTNTNTNTNTENNNNQKNTPTPTPKSKPTYKGFYMVGTIEIPKIKLNSVILEKLTNKSLNTAVAVEWPQNPVLNNPGNVVIAGHNYRNGTFFSNLNKLSTGDAIYITDLNKKKVKYVIYKMDKRSDSDTEYYNRDTNGAREITLKTCTDDGAERLFVLAKEE